MYRAGGLQEKSWVKTFEKIVIYIYYAESPEELNSHSQDGSKQRQVSLSFSIFE